MSSSSSFTNFIATQVLNETSSPIYTCIRLLFSDFIGIENVEYMHLSFDDKIFTDSSSNFSYFLSSWYIVNYVNYCLYEINRNNSANAAHGLSPVQKCSETKLK